MFQIVNNKVMLSRGQSAVYSREVRRNDEFKSPYVMPVLCDIDPITGSLGHFENGVVSGIRFPKIRISVKKNIYSKEPLLDYYGDVYPDTMIVVDIDPSKSPSEKTFIYNIEPKAGELYFVRTGGKYVGQIFEYVNDSVGYSRVFDYVPLFMSQTIFDYSDGVIEYDKLYRRSIDGTYNYFYFKNSDGDKQPYHFVIEFPIESSHTMNIAPGTYYYEISLVYVDGGEIIYKDVLLDPTEFVIGGSNVND